MLLALARVATAWAAYQSREWIGEQSQGYSHATADRIAAAVASQHAKDANQRADNYMLAVVLFASALFFAGMSAKLETTEARVATLGIGCVLFVASAIWITTFPTRV